MPNNLFVSYDLNKPHQNYEAVIKKIKEQGYWAKAQKSFWYISTEKTASEVASEIWQSMDKSDSLIVADISNKLAIWYNLSDEVSNFIKSQWVR
jgi:hypothetical protein